MGFFDDIFGGIFDFNGDGKTSWDEEWIGYKIMQDVEKELKKEDVSYDAPLLDNDEIEALTKDLDEEIDSSLADSEDEDWRDYAQENEYGINPDDYESEDEYLSAIEDAECNNGESITIPLKLSFSFEIPFLEELDSIKESDYPNKRQYKAAREKTKIKIGLILGLDEDAKARKIKQCDFILERNKDCIAANYLSTQFGEFLYAQAIKEHFELPFNVPDEDEQRITSLDTLFKQIYKVDKALIFPIWKWCIDNFAPFMEYSSDNGYRLTGGIIAEADFDDDDFLNNMAEFMSENRDFAKMVMRLSPALDNEYGILFALLLQKNKIDLATDMFKICVTKDIDCAYINGMIDGIITACSDYDELETMELFEKHILPIVKTVNRDDILSNIDYWEERIKDYYSYCDKNCVQYRYVRGNAWRNKDKVADD